MPNLTVKAILFCANLNEGSSLSINNLLVDSSEITFELNPDKTFDYILHLCSQKCNINPLYTNLFGLRDTNCNWMNLARTLDSYIKESFENGTNCSLNCNNSKPALQLEFRIRYVFQSEYEDDGRKRQSRRSSIQDSSIKQVMSDTVLKYYFHQQHSDFLNGFLPLSKDINFDEDGAALGVAVMDLLRLACELNHNLKKTLKLLGDYKKLLPQFCKDRLTSLSFLNRYRVSLKFKHFLRNFNPGDSQWVNNEVESQKYALFFYKKYLRNLELIMDKNQIESYKLVSNESSFSSSFVGVSGDSGIILTNNNGENETWCDFIEITDMRMHSCENEETNIWNVSVSQLSGKIINLAFSSLTAAENFASCVNGYYMLVKDAHHYLCKNVTSPSLVERLSVNCLGPISGAYAEYILRNQQNRQLREGDCLLRLSHESHNEYFINTVIEAPSSSEIIIRNYKLDREHDKLGIYGDSQSHIYDDLRSLLESYNEGQIERGFVPFRLDCLVHPSNKNQGTQKVLRCSESELIQDDIPVKVLPHEYAFQTFLSIGSQNKYTTISLYSHKEDKKKVVFKKVYDPNPQETHELTVKHCVDDSFQKAMWNQNCLKNDFIIKLIGKVENMWVLEYVHLGSIIDYFQHSQKESFSDQNHLDKRKYSWYLHVVWQLAHACTYLEEKGIAHGSIKGRNVLLQHAKPDPYIKLADAGVTKHLMRHVHHSSRMVTNDVVPLLPAPWLAREFCWIDNVPSSPTASYPTIGADKWSFATTVCEICDFGNISVKPCAATQISSDLQYRYLAGEPTPVPEVISESNVLTQLIKQCWNFCSQNRPPFKVLLREVGTVLSSDYAHRIATATVLPGEGSNGSVTTDLPRFEDRLLVRIKRLGQGHFGHVDLYRYDDPLFEGVREVAVKSLVRTVNTPSRDIEFAHEVEIMRRLDNKFIVKLRGVAEPSLRIVMEYLPLGSLSKYLAGKKNEGVPFLNMVNDMLNFAKQIADGMIALQKERFIHRDLALRNILLAKEDNLLYVKISDFGLSRILKEHSDYYRGNPDEFPALWYAPECLSDERNAFRFESDIWSYGVTLWEMFSYNEVPKYKELKNRVSAPALYQILEQGIRLPQPPECADVVYSLICKCWEFDPNQRPKFEVLCKCFDEIVENAI